MAGETSVFLSASHPSSRHAGIQQFNCGVVLQNDKWSSSSEEEKMEEKTICSLRYKS